MDKEKFRISVIDFMPYYRKFPIGHKDKNGKDICLGDTVLSNGDNHLIGYRYGQYCLKQPNTVHSIMLKSYENVEVLNQLTAAQEWLIIGYIGEPLIDKLKEEINIPDEFTS